MFDAQAFAARHANVTIGNDVHLSGEYVIRGEGPVVIGDNVVFGPDVAIESTPTHTVSIASRVWLGEGVQVRPGATIGEGALICAGTVVDAQVPPHAVLEGNPPRVAWYLQ